MAEYDDQELISQVWEAMPDFPERDSRLVQKINQKQAAGLGGTAAAVFQDAFSGADDDDEDDEEDESEEESGSEEEDGSSSAAEEEDADEEEETAKATPNGGQPQVQQQDFMSGLFGDGAASAPSGNVISLQQDRAKLSKLLLSPSGVLFENEMLQIGFRSQIEIPGGVMKVVLYYGNKSGSPVSIDSIQCTNTGSLPNIPIQFNPPSVSVGPKEQQQQQCRVALAAPITVLPEIEIKCSSSGNAYQLTAKFPVIATKFFRPHVFEPQQFKQRWQQLKNEQQQIMQIEANYDSNKLRGVLSSGMGMGLIAGVDQNPNNSIGCAVYHFSKKKDDSNYVTMPVLLRLEFNQNNHAIRVTVRSPHQSTSLSVMAAFEAVFKQQ